VTASNEITSAFFPSSLNTGSPTEVAPEKVKDISWPPVETPLNPVNP
jgi:hypothetical protein